MSTAMEDTKVAVSAKPEQTRVANVSLDQNRSGRGSRSDMNSNGRSNRGFKREGQGMQRSGGYRRGGGNSNHGQIPKEDINDRDQHRPQQQRINQRSQHNEDGHLGGRNYERFFYDKLQEIGGPTLEIPPLDAVEKKFSGRCRLYLGNIPPNLEEAEIKDMIKEYGEVSDIFLNRDKKFCFIRMDYHYNAEKAKNELNGKLIKNYTLKVRFAPHGSTIKVKNLDEHVSNELLQFGFSVFGDIDRAVVSLDDRGKPTGEGIVEFARKNSVMLAMRKCTEGCFFLTNNTRPVIVETYEPNDEEDGHSDRFINKNNPDYQKSRSLGPRLAHTSSFEHEFGMRWKQLYELQKRKQEAMMQDFEMEKSKLIAQMEFARYEHETAMLREELRAREMDMDRQKRQWEQKQTQAEDERRKVEERMRRQQERMLPHISQQPDDREKQETNLFLQAQQLTNMLECQEKSYYTGGNDVQLMQQSMATGIALVTDGADGSMNSIGKRRRY